MGVDVACMEKRGGGWEQLVERGHLEDLDID